MKTFSWWVLLLIMLRAACPLPAFPQTEADTLDQQSGDEEERFLEQIESEENDSDLLDRIEWLQEHRLDLNTASSEELSLIPALVPEEVSAIIRLRKMLRRFSSLNQLSLLQDGNAILQKIQPYVVVQEEVRQATSTLSAVQLRSRVAKDLQVREGFANGSFLGSPLKTYSRMTAARSSNLSVGLLVEKDAGERFSDGFASGYLALSNARPFSQVVAGDFTMEGGQGLVLWRASAFGKGAEAVAMPQKSETGIQPYRSTDEFSFFRGLAAAGKVDLGDDAVHLSAFWSRRTIPASGDEGSVSSFYSSGLFRTQSELERKPGVKVTTTGGRLRYSASQFSMGGTLALAKLDKPVLATRTYEFSGVTNSVAGVDAQLSLGWLTPTRSQILVAGEIARSAHAYAGVVSTTFNLTTSARCILLYRNYSPRFHALYANGFSDRGKTNNERGLYFGVELRPERRLRLSGYLDHYSRPWRTFENSFPSTGRDLLLQADIALTKQLDLSMRVTDRNSEEAIEGIDTLARSVKLQVSRHHSRQRVVATYTASRSLRLRSRVERVNVSYDGLAKSEAGWLLYSEVRYSTKELTLEGRLTFFDTPSYDSRVYAYENDLRGVFSNPALFGKGLRWYLLARWRVANGILVSAKYAETQKEHVTSISSGLSEIRGAIDNRLSIQLEAAF